MNVGMVVGIIAVGIALMIGYLVVYKVTDALPLTSADADTNNSISSAKTTVYAGFGLVGVGIIVLAAFSLIQVFR